MGLISWGGWLTGHVVQELQAWIWLHLEILICQKGKKESNKNKNIIDEAKTFSNRVPGRCHGAVMRIPRIHTSQPEYRGHDA